MTTGEFVHVAAQVLLAHFVVGADVAALQHRPKTFDPICVSLAVHIFLHGMLDRLVVRQPDVAAVVVSVHFCARLDIFNHEALERELVGVVDDGSGDAVGPAVLRADDGRLADGAASLDDLLALVRVHVSGLAADEGFVNLDRPAERRTTFAPSLTDSVSKEPGSFLSGFEVAVQFHARRTLEPGRQQVERDRPLLKSEVRRFHQRPSPYGEVLPAASAAVRLRLSSPHGLNVRRFAPRAGRAIRPTSLNEPLFRFCVVGKQLGELDK